MVANTPAEYKEYICTFVATNSLEVFCFQNRFQRMKKKFYSHENITVIIGYFVHFFNKQMAKRHKYIILH
jgi:hypothetical protein